MRQFILDTLDRLDGLYDADVDPLAASEAYAAAAADIGNRAARLGFADAYRASLAFGTRAEWPAVKAYLSECLAAFPEPAPAPTETYDVSDLATLLGISERAVWRRRADGTLPEPIKIGRLVRWPKAEFERWLAAR